MIRLKQDDTTTTSRLLVECLENEGVRYIFGIPGEENLELMSELKNSKIKFITTRHEQGAAFMADVYGRLTGHAGVCLATLGPEQRTWPRELPMPTVTEPRLSPSQDR